jgi:predicted RNase H-like HicB family nuclease
MKALEYSVVIEPTLDPNFWDYFSPDLPGYTGCAASYSEAIVQAIDGIPDYIAFMRETGAAIPTPNPRASITFLDIPAASAR